MSLAAMSWAWDKAPAYLTPGERFVLVALADHVDDDTGHAWPSVGRLAHRTAQSPRNVQRALRVLEAHRFISVVRQAAPTKRGDRRSNLYTWHPEKALVARFEAETLPVDNPPRTGRRGVTPSVRGDVVSPVRGDVVSPDPSLLNLRDQPTTTSNSCGNAREDGAPVDNGGLIEDLRAAAAARARRAQLLDDLRADLRAKRLEGASS